MQRLHMLEQAQIVLQCLGKAKARIENDLLLTDASSDALLHALSQEGTDLAHQSS